MYIRRRRGTRSRQPRAVIFKSLQYSRPHAAASSVEIQTADRVREQRVWIPRKNSSLRSPLMSPITIVRTMSHLATLSLIGDLDIAAADCGYGVSDVFHVKRFRVSAPEPDSADLFALGCCAVPALRAQEQSERIRSRERHKQLSYFAFQCEQCEQVISAPGPLPYTSTPACGQCISSQPVSSAPL